jgi:hypothetical protein
VIGEQCWLGADELKQLGAWEPEQQSHVLEIHASGGSCIHLGFNPSTCLAAHSTSWLHYDMLLLPVPQVLPPSPEHILQVCCPLMQLTRAQCQQLGLTRYQAL